MAARKKCKCGSYCIFIGRHWSKELYYWATVTNLDTSVFCFLLSYHKVSGQQAWPRLYPSVSKVGNRNYSKYFQRMEIWHGEFGYQIVIKTERAKQEGGVSWNAELQKATPTLLRSQCSCEPTPVTLHCCPAAPRARGQLRATRRRACSPVDAGDVGWICWHYSSRQSPSAITEPKCVALLLRHGLPET